MKQKFNKSEIMRRAHHIRNHSWYCTMSEALKQAWKEAKRNLKQREESERFLSSIKRTFYNERNALLYKNVQFGRNDWAFNYGRKYRYYR